MIDEKKLIEELRKYADEFGTVRGEIELANRKKLERIDKMKYIACMIYNITLILIVCYMCVNYSLWWLLLLLLYETVKD